MIALYRLCVAWAALAFAVGTYNLFMTGTHPVLTVVGMLVAGVTPLLVTGARIPNALVFMWFAFWALALMVLPAPDEIDSLAVFLIGAPIVFRTGWWIVEGFIITLKKNNPP